MPKTLRRENRLSGSTRQKVWRLIKLGWRSTRRASRRLKWEAFA